VNSRACGDSLRYKKDVTTPCDTVLPATHVLTGQECLGMGPHLDLSPEDIVAKRVVEVKARLHFAIQSLWSLLRAKKM